MKKFAGFVVWMVLAYLIAKSIEFVVEFVKKKYIKYCIKKAVEYTNSDEFYNSEPIQRSLELAREFMKENENENRN